MDVPSREFVLAGSIEELKAKGRLVLPGSHRPILVIYDRGRVFALDNRCPHMGFPLERGSVEDGILTCHWHHARFDLESGCTFDLWAGDIVRQVALYGPQNRDGWGVGLTILTALGNLLPMLPEEETYLALFHGSRRVASDCDGQAPRRERIGRASCR